VDLTATRPKFAELIGRMRKAGLEISDRRAVKLQNLIAGSAVLCGRLVANQTDLWVLRYVWNTEEEQDILAALVKQALDEATVDEQAVGHPQSHVGEAPDAEQLSRDLEAIAKALDGGDVNAADRSQLQDKLALLTARCQWVQNAHQRTRLEQMTSDLWNRVGTSA
jgi:MoxR-like ATPase